MNLVFKDILNLINKEITAVNAPVITTADQMDENTATQIAQKESWELLHRGIAHLDHGAPDGTNGNMDHALALTSLRSSSLAQSLGVEAPTFEPILLSIENETSPDVFLSTSLVNFAEQDWIRSREVLHLHILNLEEADALKKQMVFTFNILTENYIEVCERFKALLARNEQNA